MSVPLAPHVGQRGTTFCAVVLATLGAMACAPTTTTTPAEPITPALPPPLEGIAPSPGGDAGAPSDAPAPAEGSPP